MFADGRAFICCKLTYEAFIQMRSSNASRRRGSTQRRGSARVSSARRKNAIVMLFARANDDVPSSY